MPDFQELLAGYVRTFGSQTALGKAIDVSPSRINKVLKGEYSLDIENCLKLAEATGDSPSVILRAAGKGDVAARIEKLYGKTRMAAEPPMPPALREHLRVWSSLSEDSKLEFSQLIARVAESDADRTGRKKKSA